MQLIPIQSFSLIKCFLRMHKLWREGEQLAKCQINDIVTKECVDTSQITQPTCWVVLLQILSRVSRYNVISRL